MRFIFTETITSIMIVDSKLGETHSIPVEEEFRYLEVKEVIKNKDFSKLEKILYPDKFFIFPDFKLEGNSLYLKDEKLPNEVSLSLIKNQEEFKGLYNFWITNSNKGWEDNKKNLIDLIMSNGYPITDDGFYFVYSGRHIPCEFFYGYMKGSYSKLEELFKEKSKIDDILIKSFGESTNKLRKTVLENYFSNCYVNPSFFIIGEIFSGVLKIENIIKLLSEKKFVNSYKEMFFRIGGSRVQQIISFIQHNFKNKERKLLNLLNAEKTLNSLVQCVSLYEKLKTKINIDVRNTNFKTFEELYHIFLVEELKLREDYLIIDVPKNYPALIKNPDALNFGEYRIVYPKSNYELISWSQKMNNCIRGYSDKANSSNFLILALMKCDKMVINMEIKNEGGHLEIIQFKKYGNQSYENSKLAKDILIHIKKEIVDWKEPVFYKKIENKPFKLKDFKDKMKN